MGAPRGVAAASAATPHTLLFSLEVGGAWGAGQRPPFKPPPSAGNRRPRRSPPPLPQCEDGLLASRSSAEAAAVVAQLALLQSTVEPLLAPTGGFHSKVRPRGRRSAASEARSGTWQLRSRHVLCGGSPSGRPAPPVPPQAAH